MAADDKAVVRLFAALRDAADRGEVEVDAPVRLPALLEHLAGTLGPRFAARMSLAAIMVDGTPVDREADVVVHPGAEVALLPPFAGG